MERMIFIAGEYGAEGFFPEYAFNTEEEAAAKVIELNNDWPNYNHDYRSCLYIVPSEA